MHMSLQTKITTPVSLAAGAACAYLVPSQWLTLFFVGFLFGKLRGDSQSNLVKNGPSFESLGQMMGYSKSDDLNQRDKAARNLGRASLPGLVTTGLNLCTCYVTISKVCLPIIFGLPMTPILIGISGLFLGFNLAQYFCLERLDKWVQHNEKNRKILSMLNQIVL